MSEGSDDIDMTIEEFCARYKPCYEGSKWVRENCRSMRDAWNRMPFDELLWVVACTCVVTTKERRLIAVFAARLVEPLMSDARSVAAIEASRRYAYGEIPLTQLQDAQNDARNAEIECAVAPREMSVKQYAAKVAYEVASPSSKRALTETLEQVAWALISRDIKNNTPVDETLRSLEDTVAAYIRNTTKPSFRREDH